MQKRRFKQTQMRDGRKKFLQNALAIAGGVSVLSGLQPLVAMPAKLPMVAYTVQDIIDIILKKVPGAPFSETVDTIKSGSSSNQVSGIVTTMFSTIDVIKETVKQNANFIIAHEPTFYNHTDDKSWVADNYVLREKAALLAKHNITVWRFHDYCHALQPDAISYGVARNAGWLPYFKAEAPAMDIPPIRFKDLINHLKKALAIAHLRVIGDPMQVCKRISLLPGAAGGQAQMEQAIKEKPDVLIIGEASEWETIEFIRDGKLLGHATALIVLGHANSEEPGMQWVADWLKPLVPGVSITHITSGDPFTWL